MRQCKARLLGHMAALAMDRHQHLGSDPVIQCSQFGLAGVAGHMNMRLLLGNGQDVAFRQLVHDDANGDFIAGNLFRREDNGIALLQLDRVIALRDARQCSACLALPAGGDHHHFMSRQPVNALHIDGFGHVLQITIGLRCLDNPVQRASGKAQGPPGFARHLAHRLQPRGVGGKGGQQHPALRRFTDFSRSAFTLPSLPLSPALKSIGGIADQSKHALIADRAELFSGRWRADHWLLIELPVAGMEDLAIRRGR